MIVLSTFGAVLALTIAVAFVCSGILCIVRSADDPVAIGIGLFGGSLGAVLLLELCRGMA